MQLSVVTFMRPTKDDTQGDTQDGTQEYDS